MQLVKSIKFDEMVENHKLLTLFPLACDCCHLQHPDLAFSSEFPFCFRLPSSGKDFIRNQDRMEKSTSQNGNTGTALLFETMKLQQGNSF